MSSSPRLTPAQRAYRDGMKDGATMVLDHLEARPEARGEPYKGDLPLELVAWITDVRKRLTDA